MSLPIAIHSRGEPAGFAPRWISWCREQGVETRLVDCFDSGIVDEVRGCRALLWHFDQNRHADLLAARHILRAIRDGGVPVFPDLRSAWHFDDKIAQKYIFESLELPHVPTHCFYFHEDALKWLRSADYPIVWKLRRGAGAANVRLLRTPEEAQRLCDQAFAGGFDPVPKDFRDLKNRARRVTSWSDFWQKVKRRPGLLRQNRRRKSEFPRETSYFLAQDFIPDNDFDTRITVIEGHAWGFRRAVRPDDFRASGSGRIDYDPAAIDPACVDIARLAADRLQARCLAFDFVQDRDRGPLLVEMSYAFMPQAVADCPGYWDSDRVWRDGSLRPEDVMMQGVLAELGR